MHESGRIDSTLDSRAQRILFGHCADQAIDEELPFQVQVDRAHVVMLVERALLSRGVARRLLSAIDALASQQYRPLRGRHAPRGLYFLYEHSLMEMVGEDVSGAAHLGHSRDDIQATVLRLRLRAIYARLVREVLRLLVVLIRRAERHCTMLRSADTHHQSAPPIPYGHYLAGVALALLRDLRAIEDAASDLDRCPLWAGPAEATTAPIDTERTARLLGFTSSVLHTVDSVVSRDLVLRLLAATSVLGVTLSRLATDLQLWSTAELDCIHVPDRLLGASSMLRQERHSFLLEHIQGRAGAPLGAFTAASMAVHATPFSHSVAVGTEAVEPLRHAVSEIADAVVLTRLVFAGTPAIAEQTADGRGSAAATIPVLAELTRGWRDIAHRLREQSRRWQDAARTLERAVAALRAGVLPAADEAH